MNFITTTEAAAKLRITPSLVARYCRAGKIAAVKVGRDWLIDGDALRTWKPNPVGYPAGRARFTGIVEHHQCKCNVVFKDDAPE